MNPSGADSAGFLVPAIPTGGHHYSPASPPSSRPAQKKIGDKLHLFVFATIGDSHIRFDIGQDIRYLKDMSDAIALLTNYVGDINAHLPPVDFAVHLGDITDFGMPEEFAAAGQVLDGLTCPLHPVVGNHDNFASDHKEGWLNFAGLPSTNYSFDVQGFHFIVIDCTLDPYYPPYVGCDSTLRAWVAADLAANPGQPTVVFSHFNMWRRPWNAMFDTTLAYAEYNGMPELRQVLENSGCVVAVINGHVHANRVEIHNGIYYVDVGATLVGPPSIRYFYVYPNRIEVTYDYISDHALFDAVTAICPFCLACFSPSQVCAFIDGRDEDKRFVIPVSLCGGAGVTPPDSVAQARPVLVVGRDANGHVRAVVSSELTGVVDMSLNDVRGRSLGRCTLWKAGPDLEADLTDAMPALDRLPAGIYFVRAAIQGNVATAKFMLLP
jgi:predicted phosphodiesterase